MQKDTALIGSQTIRRKPLQLSGRDISGIAYAPVSANLEANVHRDSVCFQPSNLTIPRKPPAPTTGNPNNEFDQYASPMRLPPPQSPYKPTATKSVVPTPARQPSSTRRLTKPPRAVPVRRSTVRNRLQKRSCVADIHLHSQHKQARPVLYLLQYEKYPYKTTPGILLGAFSSLQSVTNAAFQHGAFAFSRDGLKNGMEYVSKGGRMRICEVLVKGKAGSVRSKHSMKGKEKRKHPTSVTEGDKAGRAAPSVNNPDACKRKNYSARIAIDGTTGVLVATHQSPHDLSILGAFTERRKAWAACRKHRDRPEFAQFVDVGECSDVNSERPAVEGGRSSKDAELPSMSAREVGVGRHEWKVTAWRIDDVIRR